MNNDGSVTSWLHALRGRDPEAARLLWRRYFQRMQKLARKRLGYRGDAPCDSEDIAISAFEVFCRVVHDGRYPELDGRDELWPLLARITWRKAKDYRETEGAQKRSGLREAVDIDAIAGEELTPDIEALMADECQRLLDGLDDPALVQVALSKLDGWTNEEIASQMNYTRRTIQRMLNVIRLRWQAELAPGSPP